MANFCTTHDLSVTILTALFVLNMFTTSLKCQNFYNLLPWKLIIKYSIPFLHIHLQTYKILSDFCRVPFSIYVSFPQNHPVKLPSVNLIFLRYSWLSKFIYFFLYLTLFPHGNLPSGGNCSRSVSISPSFGTLVTFNPAISNSCSNIFAYSIDPLYRWSSPDALFLNPFFIHSLFKN